MLLTENELQRQASKIKVGDIFTIVGDNAKMHSTVENIGNGEILLKNNDTKSYSLFPNTAIDGGVITMFFGKNNKLTPIPFKAIIITDKDFNEKIKILPDLTDGPDPAIEEKIIDDTKKNRAEILKELGNLKQFSEFTFYVGDYHFDEDGEGIIKDGTESMVKFSVESYNQHYFICELISVSGKYKKLFNKYSDAEFHIMMNSTLFNTDEKYRKNVALQIWHTGNKSPIILKDVYQLDVMDGEEVENDGKKDGKEDDDNDGQGQGKDLDEPRSMEDLLKDKDLMKLMNYQSVWDKALGRKAKGIKPISDLKSGKPLNTLFGFNKKPGQKITFRYLRGDSLTKGQLSLIKGKTYTGEMADEKTIKISLRNSKEKIFIVIGQEPLKDNKRRVTISYQQPDGQMDKTVNIEGYIQITK